jgi:hypothetical protein
VCLGLLFFLQEGESQKIIGLGTYYKDSFREWIITTEDESVRGELRMRWAFRNDWTEWDLRIGDVAASIEQKWDDDPNLWEIRCDGVIVQARTAWPGEFYRWKLSDGKHQINWRSPYANKLDEWSIDDPDGFSFKLYTYWEGDPREWVVLDELPEDVSLAMKVAMIFLTLHFSSPRV